MKFWTSRSFFRVGPHTRLFLAWTMTCPRSNLLGFYKFSYDDCVDETELTPKQINAAIRVGVEKDFLKFDKESRYLWIVNRLEKEFPHGQMGSIQRKSIETILHNAPCYDLVLEICLKYKYFGEPFDDLAERVGLRVKQTLGSRVKGKGRVMGSVKDKEKDKDKDKEKFLTEFEEMFWREWPDDRKIAKQEAVKEFVIARRAGATLETIMDGLRKQKRAGMMRDARYVLHPHRWLKKGRYADTIDKGPLDQERKPSARDPEPEISDEERARALEAIKGTTKELGDKLRMK